jgi:hypothetical protein
MNEKSKETLKLNGGKGNIALNTKVMHFNASHLSDATI